MRTSRASRTAALAAISAATLVTTLAGATSARADDHSSTGRVYEATNAAAGNAVQIFERATDGTLTVGPLVPTGGHGADVSLGSQGGVVRAGDRLFVVNGGDDTVSSFAITRRGLELRDVEPSGGDLPVSVTVHDDTVYVLNTGSDAITGFRVNERGHLRPIAGSTRPLSGTAVGGAQVSFADDGERLVVTEKATSRLDTYRVGRDGRASGPTVTASAGSTPFGFDVDREGHVIVSEAASGSLSSYRLQGRTLSVVTAALSDAQAAPCWVVITPNGRFAYTTNAGSGSISSYAIAEDGSLTLLASVAGATGAGPTDEAISRDGRFLYARVRNGSVVAFAISADGSLTALGEAVGATAIGSSGLAAS